MPVQYTPYAIPFVCSAVITVGLAVYGLQQGRIRGFDKLTVSFIVVVVAASIWTLSRLFQLLAVDETVKLVFVTTLYIGYGAAAVGIVCFALVFTGREYLVTKRSATALAAIPAMAVVVAATNGSHGYFWTGGLAESGHVYLDRQFQPGLYAFMAYTHGIMMVGWYLLVRMALTSGRLYRRQSVAVVVGSVTPVVIGTLFVADAYPMLPSHIDLTPAGFAVLGTTYAYAIFRFDLLDLAPIARDSVVERMRDGYIVLDDRGRIVDLNRAATEVTGCEKTSIIGKQLSQTLPEVDEYLDARAHETQSVGEITVDVDGDERIFGVHLTTLFDEDELMGRLVILRDLTDQRQLHRRYQSLIEHSSDLIIILDEDGEIRYASPSITHIVGVSADSVVGLSAAEFLPDEDQDQLGAVFDPDPESITHRRVEFRLMNADGEWRTMDGVIRNLLENPAVEGIVVNARDITERKQRERELERTNEQLDRFASIVTHDLRNPLNVAKGHLELVRETGDEQAIDEVEYSLDRMETIIDDVLTLARQGRSIGETERINLHDIALEAWDNVATNGAELVVADEFAVDADADRLLNLFENLFRNAVEHAGSEATVTVGAVQNGFFVADDGPGIPEDRRDQVLESGYTTNEGGTGFGLAIVAQVAEAHGWDVDVVESDPGGARFEFDGTTKPLSSPADRVTPDT